MADKKGLKKRKGESSSKKLVPKTVFEKKGRGHLNEISDYIHKRLKKGHKEKHIKKALLSVGWSKEMINEELLKLGGNKKVLLKEEKNRKTSFPYLKQSLREEEKKPGIFSKLFKKKPKEEKLLKSKISKGLGKSKTFQNKEEKKPEKKSKKKEERIPLVKKLPRAKIELGRYETDLDALYRLIEEKGRIRLSAIAKYFGVERKKAEEWATILQEHNLAVVHYPAIGGPELKRKIAKGEPEVKKEIAKKIAKGKPKLKKKVAK